MILRAAFENILSFKEKTSINMTSGKGKTHPSHVSRTLRSEDMSGLKLGLIYGANASGKSNIFKAIYLIQQIALGNYPSKYIEPFKLSKSIKPTSKIEVEFKTSGRYFAYGLEFSSMGINEEWLYEFNSRYDKKIFTRVSSSEGHKFEFGQIEGDDSIGQFVEFLGKGTPVKKSFLYEYTQRNGVGLERIREAYNWFAKGLHIILPDTRYRGISYNAEQDEDFHQAMRDLLNYFGTGIVDIRRFPIPSKAQTYLPESVIENVLSSLAPGSTAILATPESNECYFFEFSKDGTYKISKQKTVHKNGENQEEVFEMREESDGSIRLLDLIPMLIDFRRYEVDYLIDDLDRSLHPLLSMKLIECYFNDLSEDRDTQLLISTHESNLLNLDLIRSDEVWFVEKGKDNSSKLVSLAEYKPRENIQKGYLLGRYGAIPFFTPIETLKKDH